MSSTFDFVELVEISQKIWDEKEVLLSSSNFSNQCLYRTIINRSYYAAFNHAKNWLSFYGFETRVFDETKNKMVNRDNKSAHVLVFKELRNIAKRQNNRLKSKFYSSSSKLKTLYEKRIDADYKENVVFDKKEVEDTIVFAKSIINFLDYNMDCN